MNEPPTSPASDREWLRSLFARYERPLVSYAAKLLGGDWDRARDCVQDTFLRACREPRSSVEDHMEAWLFKCCRHRAMDCHRKESRMFIQFASEQIDRQSGPTSDPTQSLISSEERQHLQREIAALPSREQEVLVLRLQQGLSYKQIAEVMDLSVSHVGVLIHQAVTRLKHCVADI
ncbi:MAG: sigma-70 family RNA polymerase sigma factor [Pirellula sp.]|nr:sigma-70 family RNA polymerase sigma factor [Pirellula sp.]